MLIFLMPYINFITLMHKNQSTKTKKKSNQLQKHKSFKHIEKHQYQTSHKLYNINIHTQSKNDQSHKLLPTHNKTNKKCKYITQSISKSKWLPMPKQHASLKDLTLKVSTLNNIEDLNIYERPKTGKKSRKGSFNDPLEQLIRHNAKFAQQNVNIKSRQVKSQSKSQKKLFLKAFTSKQKQKCKSQKNLKPKTPKVNKSKSKETNEKTAEMLEIENSYYFDNQNSQKDQELSASTTFKNPRTRQTNSPQYKKQGMFLFESKDQAWHKPKKRFSNLQGTTDLLN